MGSTCQSVLMNVPVAFCNSTRLLRGYVWTPLRISVTEDRELPSWFSCSRLAETTVTDRSVATRQDGNCNWPEISLALSTYCSRWTPPFAPFSPPISRRRSTFRRKKINSTRQFCHASMNHLQFFFPVKLSYCTLEYKETEMNIYQW